MSSWLLRIEISPNPVNPLHPGHKPQTVLRNKLNQSKRPNSNSRDNNNCWRYPDLSTKSRWKTSTTTHKDTNNSSNETKANSHKICKKLTSTIFSSSPHKETTKKSSAKSVTTKRNSLTNKTSHNPDYQPPPPTPTSPLTKPLSI